MKKPLKPKMKNEKKIGHWMSRDVSFFGIKKIVGIFNLEMLHRLSWRSHGVVLAFVFLFSCVFSSPLRAEVRTALDSAKAVSNNLVSETSPEKPKKIAFELPVPEPDLNKAMGLLKSLDGYVGGKSNYGMAVVYEESEFEGSKELWVNFNNKMKFKGFKKLSELEFEDEVRVIFKESKEGKRLLREIQLLKKKQREGILQSLERKFTKTDTPEL